MKNIVFILTLVLLAGSCKNENSGKPETAITQVNESAVEYEIFGDTITDKNSIPIAQLSEKFDQLGVADTIEAKITAKVKEVCQKKGCWMILEMGEKEAMVRFKDYGFFMPKDLAGREVILEGKAFLDETSVEDLRHYAEDAGESPETIAAITEPEKTYTFLSNGVLVPKMNKQ